MNDFDADAFVGDVTQIDPEGLWLCGHSYLPSMAIPFSQAAALLGDSAGTESGSISRTMNSPYPPYQEMESSTIHGAWAAARDGLQNRLVESVGNLYAIGDALERIAWAADERDTDNATSLRDTVQSYLDSDSQGTDSGPDNLPIWRDEDRPDPETPEESTQRRESEAAQAEAEAENRPPYLPYPP